MLYSILCYTVYYVIQYTMLYSILCYTVYYVILINIQMRCSCQYIMMNIIHWNWVTLSSPLTAAQLDQVFPSDEFGLF